MIARRFQPSLTENAKSPQKTIRNHVFQTKAEIGVAAISLRHDLPLVPWTVVVMFRDRPDERFPVQARDPLSAARLVSYTSERTWDAQKLLAIESIHPVQGCP